MEEIEEEDPFDDDRSQCESKFGGVIRKGSGVASEDIFGNGAEVHESYEDVNRDGIHADRNPNVAEPALLPDIDYEVEKEE